MLFESSKMNQITLQSKGRYLIADCFFSVWCRFSNRYPHLFQNLLNVMWETRDVFIYILGCWLLSSHISPLSYPDNILNRPTCSIKFSCRDISSKRPSSSSGSRGNAFGRSCRAASARPRGGTCRFRSTGPCRASTLLRRRCTLLHGIDPTQASPFHRAGLER
jgi:hypothetical protein